MSGGHLNPVITVALNLDRGSSWLAVITLLAAQYTGAALAGALAFLVYWEGITWFEHQVGEFRPTETAQIFSTFPLPQVSLISAMFDQFIGERERDVYSILYILTYSQGVGVVSRIRKCLLI